MVAAQLRAARAPGGGAPGGLDPEREAIGLLAMASGLGTSMLAGQSTAERAQAVIDYHLGRLFPAGQPAFPAAPA